MTAAKLLSADMVILAQLQERIAIGGRWWRDLPGIGRTKAQRIESHLTMLLSEQPQPKMLEKTPERVIGYFQDRRVRYAA